MTLAYNLSIKFLLDIICDYTSKFKTNSYIFGAKFCSGNVRQRFGEGGGVISGKGGRCYAMNFLMECIKGGTMVLDKS